MPEVTGPQKTSFIEICCCIVYIRFLCVTDKHVGKYSTLFCTSPSFCRSYTLRPIVFIQPGVQDMSIIIYAFKVSIEWDCSLSWYHNRTQWPCDYNWLMRLTNWRSSTQQDWKLDTSNPRHINLSWKRVISNLFSSFFQIFETRSTTRK